MRVVVDREWSQYRCPYDGGRLVADIGADDDGTAGASYWCWECGYREHPSAQAWTRADIRRAVATVLARNQAQR